jgi:hypothetical protein
MAKILMQTKVEPEVIAFFMDAAWREGKSLSAFLAQWLTDCYHEGVEPYEHPASAEALIELGRAAGVHLRVASSQPRPKKRPLTPHVSPHSPPAAPQCHRHKL